MLILKDGVKQNLILFLFCLFLREVLTLPTLSFVFLGILLTIFGVKTTKLFRNVIALAVFTSYWLKYGKLIDPEIGLNFLTSIIVLKILERETVRDRYMIFFGLVLVISAGSLFERTLTYVFFFTASFVTLIGDFYSFLGQKWRWKDIGHALLWVSPLTLSLFFFVPRILNPIPFQQNSFTEGEIGYRPDVNISEIDRLQSNTNPVFQVMTSRPLLQSELYWRGNTLSWNDGWNWKEMPQDREGQELLLGMEAGPGEVQQKYRLFTRADYFFSLDYPRTLSHHREFFGLTGTMRTVPQHRWEWVQRYEIISDPGRPISGELNGNRYLRVSLPKKEKKEFEGMFPGVTVDEIVSSIRSKFRKENFSYSLAPGKTLSMREFFSKKTGLCSHYASTTAIIFRLKGIPSRLVSGFMGGSYNRFANFYLVSQNDAHVWVEVLDGDVWRRLDPTEWIAPDRVQLGGGAFVENATAGVFRGTNLRMPAFFQDLRLWINHIDFQFYQWLENMDYSTQEALLSKINLRREHLFSVVPLVMVLFMLAYTVYLAMSKNSHTESPHHEVWRLFRKKMKKRGIAVSVHSVSATDPEILSLGDPQVKEVWEALVGATFGEREFLEREMKTKIRNL